MSEKEKESLFEELERLKEEDRQDFLWYAVFGILKSDVDESAPRSDRNKDKSANREAALQKCVELAYRDFNRTLEFTYSGSALEGLEKKKATQYIKCKDSWRDGCEKLLHDEIELLHDEIELLQEQNKQSDERQSCFDEWHKDLCEKLVKESKEAKPEAYEEPLFEKNGFTIGHAQKWVNMTLKYMLIMNISGWEMGKLASCLHVPIDNYILRYVYKTYKEEWGAYKLSGNVCIYADGKIKIDPKEDPKYSWSKISNYDKHYKPIQDHLMGLAKDEGKCPIAWENPAWLMAAKWQQEKDEQNKKSKTIAT